MAGQQPIGFASGIGQFLVNYACTLGGGAVPVLLTSAVTALLTFFMILFSGSRSMSSAAFLCSCVGNIFFNFILQLKVNK